jgi:hypothetical protein
MITDRSRQLNDYNANRMRFIAMLAEIICAARTRTDVTVAIGRR